MKLTPAQVELLDHNILRALRDNNLLFGLPVAVIALELVGGGFTQLSDEEIVFRLEYLAGKGLVKEVAKTISANHRAWKLADAGRQYHDEHGL